MLLCSWSHTICNRYNHSIKRLMHIHILLIGLTIQYHCYSGGFVIGITLTNNVMKPDVCYDRCSSSRRILRAHHVCETWLRCPTYGRDVNSYWDLRFCNLCRPPWLTSSSVLCNVFSVAYLVLSGHFKGSCVWFWLNAISSYILP